MLEDATDQELLEYEQRMLLLQKRSMGVLGLKEKEQDIITKLEEENRQEGILSPVERKKTFYVSVNIYGGTIKDLAECAREQGIVLLSVNGEAVQDLSPNRNEFHDGQGYYIFVVECAQTLHEASDIVGSVRLSARQRWARRERNNAW